jgi:helicase
MATKAYFIGINKYQDSQIRDLAGATRDATALWALFSDTIPDIESHLIVDANATVEEVKKALENTLNNSTSEDTVIFTFAGHGTHDHRLVLHDTNVSSLEDTTISMTELADNFKSSAAKAILCVLDCCFSGGAPARVLEESPVARNPIDPYQSIAGKGRVLIAASNFDEQSYEMPGGGHGLLTKALLDVLQGGTDVIEIQSAMSQVLDQVRALAARLGVNQTPVHLGYIEGGLTFPVLKAGHNFYENFPESKGVKVTSNITDLSVFGFPDEILNEWANWFQNGLNELQLNAVNDYRILDGESLFIVAPTSSGKTFVGEMSAVKSVLQGNKAVFLLPYKALVNEKYDQFLRLYGERLNLRIIQCTGDRLDGSEPFMKGKYDIALLTYEMFLGLAVSTPNILNQIGLVVLDEGQFITDPNRGVTVELLLTYLIAARENGVNPQLIVLSAVIGDINNFDEWLSCKKLVTNKRPVPLVEGVLDRSGTFQFVDNAGQAKTEQLLPYGSVHQRGKSPSSQDVIVPLVQHLLSQNRTEQIIIFRNNRGSAEGCANYLAKDLGLAAATEVINKLPTRDLSSSSMRLKNCLEGGTAFHNTNLHASEKEVVERSFRDPSLGVRVLGATTTVAAGINTPASTVIIAEQEFMGEDGRPFTIAEYKNMAGRAGRLGYSEEGKAIILADNSYQRENLFQKYVLGDLEPLRSSFDTKNIETWILRLLAQIGRINRMDVARLLANTYGGYLATRNHPEWRNDIEVEINTLLLKFIDLELVEEEDGEVKLTLLGQVCGRSSLQFRSVIRLLNLLRNANADTLTAEGLAILIQGLPELDRVATPIAKGGRKDNRVIVQTETGWTRQAANKFGHELIYSLQKNADDFFAYYARCKRALILANWVEGVSIEEIEEQYSVNFFYAISYGHIRGIVDATRFHLRAAHQIASILFIDRGPDETSIENLLKQLEEGLPVSALGLLAIPVELTRGEYLSFFKAGVTTVNDLWKLNFEKISEILEPDRALEIEKFRPT